MRVKNYLRAVACSGLLSLCGSQASAAGTLDTVAVQLVEVPQMSRLDGVVEASEEATIAAQTSGQVSEVLFDVDDVVNAGDVIVVIQDKEQQARTAQAKANLKAALAQKAEAAAEYERVKKVFAKDAVSEAVMDKATASLQSANANVDAARASLSQAEQQLGYTQVKAPYTGIVTERMVEVGEIASPGKPLMSGISLQNLRVVVDVPQSLVNPIRQQKTAMIMVDRKWVRAEKLTVFPMADPGSDTFRVRLYLPDSIGATLYPGMFVKAGFQTGDKRVLVVPPEAVVFRSEVIGIYVVADDGRIGFRHIRLGEGTPDGRHTILAGLSEGERVALNPQAAVVALKEQRKERLHDE